MTSNPSATGDVSVRELEPGLVLFLHPGMLRERGARSPGAWWEVMLDPHYFVCLDVEDSDGIWIPASTKEGPGRFVLEPRDKRGPTAWTRGRSWCLVDQLWTAPHAAILEAAFLDDSRPGRRSFVSEEACGRLTEAAASA